MCAAAFAPFQRGGSDQRGSCGHIKKGVAVCLLFFQSSDGTQRIFQTRLIAHHADLSGHGLAQCQYGHRIRRLPNSGKRQRNLWGVRTGVHSVGNIFGAKLRVDQRLKQAI